MGFASVFHHGVRIPTNSDLGLLSVSQRIPAWKWSGVHSHASRFYSVYHCRHAYCVLISWSKGTNHDDDLSASGKRVCAQPRDGIGNIETPQAHASVDTTKESHGNEAYTSSIRTVALWWQISNEYDYGAFFTFSPIVRILYLYIRPVVFLICGHCCGIWCWCGP